MLISKELPVELAVKIMEHAHYEANRRLTPVPHNPFHPSNREELVKYLNYCWELFVCCEMTGRLFVRPVNVLIGTPSIGMTWSLGVLLDFGA